LARIIQCTKPLENLAQHCNMLRVDDVISDVITNAVYRQTDI